MSAMQTASRTGQAAIDYARSRVGPNAMPASGYCLQFTRECFAVPAYYGSAIDAAYGCETPHPGDWNPPPAVPVYFTTPSVYDHVCFFVSPTEVISTFNADVRTFRGLEDIERNFDGVYRGWGEDLNERVVWTPTPTPTPEDEMPTSVLYRHPSGTIALAAEDGTFVVLASMDEVEAMKYAGNQINLGTGPAGTVPLPDGLVWNMRAQIAARKAALSSPDPAAVAAAIAPLLVPPVLDALAAEYDIPAEAVEAAAALVVAELATGE